ncbi:toxin HipA [Moraxella atlantae]|uniref:Toxin HipA n=1 Tax=Faucicola atlantae TaxID=34059 RepID=A0A1B8QBC3_9GAMM|nr:HipA domain-containing protein [Moraxella atlantae]OBX77047.1 toxin HipA [Moraxella atlantae]
MKNSLTFQAFLDQQWQDIAELTFDEFNLIEVAYLGDYSFQHYLADNWHAFSINYPVELFGYRGDNGWLPILDDIIPAGAGRRYWLNYLGLAHLSEPEQNFRLLQSATIAPIGHLRIKQAVENLPIGENRSFDIEEVVNRHADFLDYANQMGAIAGGATGAGGEAPKLVLRVTSNDKVWIDHQQLADGPYDAQDSYYLVKFPRGTRSEIDCDILRAEYHYYQELASLGFDTIETTQMRLIEGERYPSLWLPRFDVRQNKQGQIQRLAMESVYAMLKQQPATRLYHGQTIRALIDIMNKSNMTTEGFKLDKTAFVIEWVKRDLLNIAFGNSDNHGRNTAFLRGEHSIWLSPIYDFAPMKADPEGIARSMIWQNDNGQTLELGGHYNFIAICESLADLIEPSVLLDELKQTAEQLVDLPKRLQQRGVSEKILSHPAIAFDYLPKRLQDWGLL